jgi:polyferredoxin
MTGEKTKAAIRKVARWRLSVQLLSLLVWLDPLMVRCHTVCAPVLHCYSCPLATFACPIGVLANFSAIHVIPFLALGTLAVAGALFGSFICGWTCPFGLLQDLLDRVPTPKFVLPNGVGYLRFLVLLGLVIVVPYLWGDGHALFFCRVCPAGALEAAVPNTVHTAIRGEAIVWPTITKSVILVVFVVLALFTWRPWCSALCPLGVIFSVCNGASLLVMRFHRRDCIECVDCRSLCHTGEDARVRVNQIRCIRCLECTRCRAVTVETAFGRMKDKG